MDGRGGGRLRISAIQGPSLAIAARQSQFTNQWLRIVEFILVLLPPLQQQAVSGVK